MSQYTSVSIMSGCSSSDDVNVSYNSFSWFYCHLPVKGSKLSVVSMCCTCQLVSAEL